MTLTKKVKHPQDICREKAEKIVIIQIAHSWWGSQGSVVTLASWTGGRGEVNKLKLKQMNVIYGCWLSQPPQQDVQIDTKAAVEAQKETNKHQN